MHSRNCQVRPRLVKIVQANAHQKPFVELQGAMTFLVKSGLSVLQFERAMSHQATLGQISMLSGGIAWYYS